MAKKWISEAINPENKGALHRALHVKQGEKIPADMLNAAAKKKGVTGKRARLAMTLRQINN